ncbi:MAG: hypothetical protein Q8M76_02595 [Spirochaetaceae bacterium]|nr:hypothetical protein [Spirochaetaceae bacterium]
MTRTRAYAALIGISGAFAAAAVATLIPNPMASWQNVLGYKSLCTFAPMATAACAFLAGVTCVARARLVGPRAGEKRPWTFPIVIGLLLAAVAVSALPAYVSAKEDAVSGASEAMEE